MERRINLAKLFSYFIIFVIVGTTLGTYYLVSELTRYDNKCKTLGGIPVHGNGIDLCLKPEVLLGEDNG